MLSRLFWLRTCSPKTLWRQKLLLRVTVMACKSATSGCDARTLKRDVYKCDFPFCFLPTPLIRILFWMLQKAVNSAVTPCLSEQGGRLLKYAVCFALLCFSGSCEPACWDLALLQEGCLCGVYSKIDNFGGCLERVIVLGLLGLKSVPLFK